MSASSVRRRLIYLLSLLVFGLAVATRAQARTAHLPIPPHALLIAPVAFPGFVGAKPTIEATDTVRRWTRHILEDQPANERVEVKRLRHEGFREGALEFLASNAGFGFLAAVVVRSHRAARREASVKVVEESAELGPGVTRFAVTSIAGAVGLTATDVHGEHMSGVSIVFHSGDCLLVTAGLFFETVEQAAAQTAVKLAAQHELVHAKKRCA